MQNYRREEEAIYIGEGKKKKLMYRAEKADGTLGVAYINGKEEYFASCDDLLREVINGPRKKIG